MSNESPKIVNKRFVKVFRTVCFLVRSTFFLKLATNKKLYECLTNLNANRPIIDVRDFSAKSVDLDQVLYILQLKSNTCSQK